MMDPVREAAVWERVRAAAAGCCETRKTVCAAPKQKGVSVRGGLPLLVLAAALLRLR